jgi:hypothetical protein
MNNAKIKIAPVSAAAAFGSPLKASTYACASDGSEIYFGFSTEHENISICCNPDWAEATARALLNQVKQCRNPRKCTQKRTTSGSAVWRTLQGGK